ncbi:hypothetical protein [Agrobacterium sp. MS2]|uniref:type II toxin-antitoxin system RelE family toxin n=1 Tax=Agrobacterium sp. MS2 TaxID=1345498 RepID=UPI000DB776EC|nr:hypothetical protein [Agrobacterium sp. MS2]PZP59498.1 MAG: hypothetical protein DI604_32340 [Delftia acidovorans]RAL95621.1 hypothetical protein DOU54_20920 [Agrobacterium sp. MS2]
MKCNVTVRESFKKGLKSLPPDRAKAAIQTIELFMQEPARPRFNYRQLQGSKGYFIINVKRGDRIILQKLDDNSYVALDVGPHDNIYRRWNRL